MTGVRTHLLWICSPALQALCYSHFSQVHEITISTAAIDLSFCSRAHRGQNKKLPTKKKDITSGKNVSRICSETLLKSLQTYQKHSELDVKLGNFTEEEFDSVFKKLKAEKLQALKYLLKFRKQENLMTYFFDYATQCTNKTE